MSKNGREESFYTCNHNDAHIVLITMCIVCLQDMSNKSDLPAVSTITELGPIQLGNMDKIK